MALSTASGARHVTSKVLIAAVTALLALGAVADGYDRETWAATWATANKVQFPGFDDASPAPVANDTTLRQIVRISLGGRKFRVWLSNELGTEPLNVARASIARRLEGSAIQNPVRRLLFSGHESITIPPGARVVSDPVRLHAKNDSDLTISIHLPDDLTGSTSPVTYHPRALQTNYVDSGDQVMHLDLGSPQEIFVSAYLAAVDVAVRRPVPVVAALGDSTTDGDGAAGAEPIDLNARYTNFLSEKIHGKHLRASVVNLGISGNQVTNDLLGDNAVARVGRDVLSRTGVTHVVVWEGINDIGLADFLFGAPTPAAAIISGLQQIAAQARAAGYKVVGCTITPAGGFILPTYGSNDDIRNEVNDWIRHSGTFDAVADLDALMRDPHNPNVIKGGEAPNEITPDGLHFTPKGYRMIAKRVLKALYRSSGYRYQDD